MVDNTREILAFNLALYRKKAGLNQSDVAKIAKISLRTVQRAEDPSVQALDLMSFIAISNAIGIHPAKLLLPENERVPVSPEECLEVLAKALAAKKSEKIAEKPSLPVVPGLDESQFRALLAALTDEGTLRAVMLAAGLRTTATSKKSQSN